MYSHVTACNNSMLPHKMRRTISRCNQYVSFFHGVDIYSIRANKNIIVPVADATVFNVRRSQDTNTAWHNVRWFIC